MQYELARATKMANNAGYTTRYNLEGKYSFIFQIDRDKSGKTQIYLHGKATKTLLDITYVHDTVEAHVNLSMTPMATVHVDQIDRLIDQLQVVKDAMLTIPEIIADMESRGFLSFDKESTQ